MLFLNLTKLSLILTYNSSNFVLFSLISLDNFKEHFFKGFNLKINFLNESIPNSKKSSVNLFGLSGKKPELLNFKYQGLFILIII